MPSAFFTQKSEFSRTLEHLKMTLDISEKYRGCLGASSKCLCTQASVIRKIEIFLKNISTKCILMKNPNFQGRFHSF